MKIRQYIPNIFFKKIWKVSSNVFHGNLKNVQTIVEGNLAHSWGKICSNWDEVTN